MSGDSNRDNTSYCGLWCLDCIPSYEELFSTVEKLKGILNETHFKSYAEYKSNKVKEFQQYDVFLEVLNAFEKIRCYKGPHSVAGCASDCKIRQCCLEKEIDGCWRCEQYHNCESIIGMSEMHPDIVNNLDILHKNGINRWKNARGKHYNF
ncbi:MAG: DUF3795 domain-containing protein [Clostridiales bacterium]|nr:DUF3795 domain-containing protein [Clostridiales bacterium]